MRYTILVVMLVLATSYVDSAMDSIRSSSSYRTLRESESAAIYGGEDSDVLECTKISNCWNLPSSLCSDIALDPMLNESDLATVSQKCSQSDEVLLYTNGPNKNCQVSKKEANKCYLQAGDPVPCRRVTRCTWNSQTKKCEKGTGLSIENFAPPDCLNL